MLQKEDLMRSKLLCLDLVKTEEYTTNMSGAAAESLDVASVQVEEKK